ncbi:collagen triple helix repeat-containing protein 1 [Lingula anatina]|uniref:Collagen triple helix repeat-containing protein 1 n=1 Tax=Lingula anatina TaxID=7574 RepID=A0A1S3HTP3_LINAN|nr:collagen triple helix repeat-containing protein 1 [Lingula anatina]|eukprot:XP_013388916.1 collagen triple helix repeat-containing protein 1 [Lingula anatina]
MMNCLKSIVIAVLAVYSILAMSARAQVQQCGKDGKDGKDGTNGTNGRDGRDGRDGLQGERGPPGPKGENGSQCSPRNIRQFTWTDINDGKDDGLIKEVTFFKAEMSTMLRVAFHGNIRVMTPAGQTESCRRYWLTFNNTECDSPASIDTQFYSTHQYNIHRDSTLEGICEHLRSGQVAIGVHVGPCKRGESQLGGDAYTGWNSATRIIVEEI